MHLVIKNRTVSKAQETLQKNKLENKKNVAKADKNNIHNLFSIAM